MLEAAVAENAIMLRVVWAVQVAAAIPPIALRLPKTAQLILEAAVAVAQLVMSLAMVARGLLS
jgi:uncharacterized membrane protein